MNGPPFRVFISYSHEDEALRASLDKHLSQLRHDGLIESWHDHQIAPGKEWENEIFAALEAADIVLLLVSASFIASEFCYGREMTLALQRHENGLARVVPVILRPCDWETAPFGKLQALPALARAITTWSNQDEAFLNVARGIRGMLEGLQGLPPALFAATIFSVPVARNSYFTGREEMLAKLNAQLKAGGRAAVSQVAAISGLGGIGKTQTAVEFAYRHRDQYRAVFFVRSETPGLLLGAFADIAIKLGIASQEQDQNAAAQASRQWFEQHDEWLLIFDNADDPALLEPYLPAAGQGHVLITSRAQDLAVLAIKGQKLAPPPDGEALDFLLNRTDRPGAGEAEKKAAAELAGLLGNLPLALEQAAAYLVEHGESFASYLKSFRKKGVELFEETQPQLGGHDPLKVTWSMNFEAVRHASQASADLLNAIAFLAPDAIPDELILEGGSAISQAISKVVESNSNLAVGKLAAPLLRYSLLERDPEERALRVHRLVQETVKGSLGKTRSKTIERVVKALRYTFPWPEFETWPRCERLLPHLLAIAGVAAGGENLAWLLRAGGVYLWNRGRFAEAEPLFERSLAIREKSLGGEHPDVAHSLNSLAILYKDQGRLAEAESLYKRALAIWEKSLGGDHPDLAAWLNNLAILYVNQGRFVEAEPLHERALAILEKSLGGEHPRVASSLTNLASLYWYRGRVAEAERLYERSLAIMEKSLGGQHPHVSHSLDGLAIVYGARGRVAEAEALYERSLAIREKSLGGEHPDVATTLNNLASFYRNQGRFAEAEPLYDRSLSIWKKSLGGEHPYVATALTNLANLRRQQGHESEAEELEARARQVRARHEDRNRRPPVS
jgi:tetratricopeptide (TPR) repeat protein